MPPGPDPRVKLLADITAKVAELKAVIRAGNAVLKDLRGERKGLRADLAWAEETHRALLADMVERSSAEVLRATAGVMDTVARQLTDVVARSQSVQVLTRVDRLLHYVETRLEDDGKDPGDGDSDGSGTGPSDGRADDAVRGGDDGPARVRVD